MSGWHCGYTAEVQQDMPYFQEAQIGCLWSGEGGASLPVWKLIIDAGPWGLEVHKDPAESSLLKLTFSVQYVWNVEKCSIFKAP